MNIPIALLFRTADGNKTGTSQMHSPSVQSLHSTHMDLDNIDSSPCEQVSLTNAQLNSAGKYRKDTIFVVENNHYTNIVRYTSPSQKMQCKLNLEKKVFYASL